jgi:hypothetical protein
VVGMITISSNRSKFFVASGANNITLTYSRKINYQTKITNFNLGNFSQMPSPDVIIGRLLEVNNLLSVDANTHIGANDFHVAS